jgi:hypothetical protein
MVLAQLPILLPKTRSGKQDPFYFPLRFFFFYSGSSSFLVALEKKIAQKMD